MTLPVCNLNIQNVKLKLLGESRTFSWCSPISLYLIPQRKNCFVWVWSLATHCWSSQRPVITPCESPISGRKHTPFEVSTFARCCFLTTGPWTSGCPWSFFKWGMSWEGSFFPNKKVGASLLGCKCIIDVILLMGIHPKWSQLSVGEWMVNGFRSFILRNLFFAGHTVRLQDIFPSPIHSTTEVTEVMGSMENLWSWKMLEIFDRDIDYLLPGHQMSPVPFTRCCLLFPERYASFLHLEASILW